MLVYLLLNGSLLHPLHELIAQLLIETLVVLIPSLLLTSFNYQLVLNHIFIRTYILWVRNLCNITIFSLSLVIRLPLSSYNNSWHMQNGTFLPAALTDLNGFSMISLDHTRLVPRPSMASVFGRLCFCILPAMVARPGNETKISHD